MFGLPAIHPSYKNLEHRHTTHPHTAPGDFAKIKGKGRHCACNKNEAHYQK